MYELLQMMQSFCEKLLQQKQAASIDQSPPQEMSIQDIEDLKQHYLDEMLSLSKFNGMSIESNKKKELQHLEQVANLSTYPSRRMNILTLFRKRNRTNSLKYKVLRGPCSNPSESGILTGVHSDCDLFCVMFLSHYIFEEKSVTFSNHLFDSNDDFTSSDDESLSDEDVPEVNVKIYSNPFFEFDDEYISSDINPLFDEVLKDIESKDSYVSNLDEPALLVTPLFDDNKDECFDPGSDVDEIEFLLHRDPLRYKR
ncbi:hypothetical protein Tco_1534046 [Tanacetum coccineum]